VNGESGQRYRLEFSENFGDWTQFSEGALSGPTTDVPLSIENGRASTFIRSITVP